MVIAVSPTCLRNSVRCGSEQPLLYQALFEPPGVQLPGWVAQLEGRRGCEIHWEGPLPDARLELAVLIKREDRQSALDNAQAIDPAVHMGQLVADQPGRWATGRDPEWSAFEVFAIDCENDGPGHLPAEFYRAETALGPDLCRACVLPTGLAGRRRAGVEDADDVVKRVAVTEERGNAAVLGGGLALGRAERGRQWACPCLCPLHHRDERC